MSDEPLNGSPVTIRELGVYVSAIHSDIADIKSEFRDLRAEVRMNTDYRKERQAQERVIRWLIGSNLAALIGMVVSVLIFVRA